MSRPKVLVVDDEEELRELLCEFLGDHDFDAQGAADGMDALRQLDEPIPPDAIILDMMMRPMDGTQFLRHKVGSRSHAVPVIVCTASKSLQSPPPGAQVVLTKPIDLEALLLVLDDIVHPVAH